MKSSLLTRVFSILLAVLPSGATADELYKYDLKVGEFDELKVVDHLNVNYVCNPDSAGHAVFNASRQTASMMMFQNNGGKLSVQLSTDGAEVSDLPTVTLYSSFLTKAENSGDSTLRVLSMAPLPKLTVKLIGNGRLIVRNIRATKADISLMTGNGTIVVSGQCQEETIKFAGTGLIQADELEAKTVSLKSMGTGSIGCWATEKLSIYGMGSSKIYYKGSPEIKNKSVGLKVISMESR